MKKAVFCAVVLVLAAPVRAVDVWCVVDTNLVTVKYSGAVDVRAFALDIQLDGDGTISDVQCLSPNSGYQIYPGSISIDSSGNVSEWGNCKCSGSYPGTLDDSNSMTIEMGSAYEAGVDPDPCDAGDLVSFVVGGTGIVNVILAANEIRGGVVNEDSVTVIPSITECYADFGCCCLNGTAMEYAAWSAFGMPACWCYRKQCRGDIDGLMTGPFPVGIPDLTLFKAAFNKIVIPEPPGVCADLDHVQTGPFRCAIPDLTIFKQNFNKLDSMVPRCDEEPIYTGPYNFWTN
ncbi:MAG: hypothetical protein ACYST6_13365 [Planctomycetota bacterium]|jgi:hypothetical protein